MRVIDSANGAEGWTEVCSQPETTDLQGRLLEPMCGESRMHGSEGRGRQRCRLLTRLSMSSMRSRFLSLWEWWAVRLYAVDTFRSNLHPIIHTKRLRSGSRVSSATGSAGLSHRLGGEPSGGWCRARRPVYRGDNIEGMGWRKEPGNPSRR